MTNETQVIENDAIDTVNAETLFNYAVDAANEASAIEKSATAIRYGMVVAFAVAHVAAVNGWGGSDALAVSASNDTFNEWNKAQEYSKAYRSKVKTVRGLLAKNLQDNHKTLAAMMAQETDAGEAVKLYMARLATDGITTLDGAKTTLAPKKEPKVEKGGDSETGAADTVHSVNQGGTQGETTQPPVIDADTFIMEAIESMGADMTDAGINAAILALATIERVRAAATDEDESDTLAIAA